MLTAVCVAGARVFAALVILGAVLVAVGVAVVVLGIAV
jgi:hypothetical protein